jgi:amino acid adenylation domain-containing protein
MRYLLQHGLEAASRNRPDAVAVVDGDRTVTYEELDATANRLAGLLMDIGVRRGDRVGLYLDKSIASIVGIYGALKAGAAYVPMDPQAPASRLGYIAANCGIGVLLSATEKASTWDDIRSAGGPIENIVVLNADEVEGEAAGRTPRVIGEGALKGFDPTPPPIPTIGLDLGYILYTSGSTGQPKGVMLSHLNGLAFVDWAVEEFGVGPHDRLSSHAPLHFDLSIFDVFAASCAAATLVLVPPQTSYFPIEVARFIERHEISVWYSVPSILNMLVTRGDLKEGRLSSLRTLLFAGEVFPTTYLRQLMELLPGVRFANLYGPTETNVCTWYEVEPIPESQTDPIPVGRAIAGVEVFAVNDDGRPADPGEVGELYVRGPTVMQGYWGDPDKTSASLLPPPLGARVRDLAYRTGDLVQERPDGNYRLLGRRDHQIKSRGYRIELGDIESVLQAHPAVVECAVIAVPDPMVTNTIRAHVVAKGDIGERDLIDFVGERLPRYMIPETFEFRPSLPKTSTGKIDRQALRDVPTTRAR